MSHPSPRPVTALRARMIEDMMVRGFTEETRTDYVRHVRAFAAFIRRPPDTATAEDLRRFQLHQRQSGMQPPSINNSVSALRFFFTATLDRPDLARRLTVVREPLRLPSVLSVEEVTLLLHPQGERPCTRVDRAVPRSTKPKDASLQQPDHKPRAVPRSTMRRFCIARGSRMSLPQRSVSLPDRPSGS
jgi:hypothetical protein